MDRLKGKFLLRMPAELHEKLMQSAEKNNISLNQYIVYLLSKSEYSLDSLTMARTNTSLNQYLIKEENSNMSQSTESGRRGNEVGRIVGQAVAVKLDIELEEGSNKGVYNGRKAVIKSARIDNSQFGVTNRMLQEIQDVILAKEVSENNFELYRVDYQNLINTGKPTASKGSSASKVTNFSVSTAVSAGELIGQIFIELPYPPHNSSSKYENFTCL